MKISATEKFQRKAGKIPAGSVLKTAFAGAAAALFAAALPACSDLNYTDNKDRLERERDKSDFNKDQHMPDLAGENCTQYKAKVKSFRPISDTISTLLTGSAQENPFRYAENCILKSADESLKPVCEEKRALKEELREYKNDPEVLEEIEEELEYVEDAQYEYAEILYEFADELDEIADDLGIEDPENGWERAWNLMLRREARSYADVVALTARRFCGSDLRKDRRKK